MSLGGWWKLSNTSTLASRSICTKSYSFFRHRLLHYILAPKVSLNLVTANSSHSVSISSNSISRRAFQICPILSILMNLRKEGVASHEGHRGRLSKTRSKNRDFLPIATSAAKTSNTFVAHLTLEAKYITGVATSKKERNFVYVSTNILRLRRCLLARWQKNDVYSSETYSVVFS